MDITFSSLEQLYQRLRPALSARRSELKRNGYVYATEEDIWNYLKEMKWKNAKDLSLYQMTCDIFDIDDQMIENYLKDKMNMRKRKLYFED